MEFSKAVAEDLPKLAPGAIGATLKVDLGDDGCFLVDGTKDPPSAERCDRSQDSDCSLKCNGETRFAQLVRSNTGRIELMRNISLGGTKTTLFKFFPALFSAGRRVYGQDKPLKSPDKSKDNTDNASQTTNMSRFTWVPDSERTACKACKSKFTLFLRKHHCRRCGEIFCKNCTDYTWTAAQHRICEECFLELKKKQTEQDRHSILSDSNSVCEDMDGGPLLLQSLSAVVNTLQAEPVAAENANAGRHGDSFDDDENDDSTNNPIAEEKASWPMRLLKNVGIPAVIVMCFGVMLAVALDHFDIINLDGVLETACDQTISERLLGLGKLVDNLVSDSCKAAREIPVHKYIELLETNPSTVMIILLSPVTSYFGFRIIANTLFVRRCVVYFNAFIVIGTLLYLKRTAHWRKHLTEEQEEEVWSKAHTKLSARVLGMIRRLRGLWVKAGQYMSSRSDVMPKEWIQPLSTLQDSLPPIKSNIVRKQVEKEFGILVEDLFSEWDDDALATASIAQVHKAKLASTGQVVAVKVKHKGIDAMMKQDMNNIEKIMSWVAYFEPEFDFKPVIEEWAKVALKELDFNNEATNQQTVRDNLKAAKVNVIVPELVSDKGRKLVSTGVLVMEFCEGFKVTDLDMLDKYNVDREALMKRICQAYAQQVYIDGFFNADPHPGNILVQVKDGQATPVLLDFGMVKVLDETKRLAFARLIFSTASMDFGGLLKSFDEMGLKMKRDDPMKDMQAMRFVLRDTAPGKESRAKLKKFREERWKERQALPKSQRNPVESWPADLLFFFRVTMLLKGMCSELEVRLKYMSVLAPYAQLALVKAIPIEHHSRKVISHSLHNGLKPARTLQHKLQSLLARLYREGQVIGAQVCVYQNGKELASVCAGIKGSHDPRPVQEDTLFNCFSVTKAVAAVALLQYVDERRISLSDYVVNHWPEFGVHGKGRCSIHHVLTHRTGLHRAGLGSDIGLKALASWQDMLDHMAKAKGESAPGEKSAYHTLSFGWIIGGILRAVTKGEHMRDICRRRIAEPLGLENEFFMGLGITGCETELAISEDRVATLTNGFLKSGIGKMFSSHENMSKDEMKQMLRNLVAQRNGRGDAEVPSENIKDEKKEEEKKTESKKPLSFAELISKAKADKLRELLSRTSPQCDSGKEWTQFNDNDGVKMWKQTTDQGIAVRGRATVKAPVNVTVGYLAKRDTKQEWDKLFDCGRDIEITDDYDVVSEQFKGIWPAAGRDFCVKRVVQKFEDGTWALAATSTTHPDCPPVNKIVRGTCFLAGFLCRPTEDPKTCVLDYISHSDLGGSIPAMILNVVAQKQPENVLNIRNNIHKFNARQTQSCIDEELELDRKTKIDDDSTRDTSSPQSTDDKSEGSFESADGGTGETPSIPSEQDKKAAAERAKAEDAIISLLKADDQPTEMGTSSLLLDPCIFNTSQIRKACIPSANGHFTARALARFYAALANQGELDGARILSAETVKLMSQPHATMQSMMRQGSITWGLGVRRLNESAFGHDGLGGSFAFCDPKTNTAVAVAVNNLELDRDTTKQVVELISETLNMEPINLM
eukprot:m.121005 g.121005  ORF g.121005 m.121005 type:complete len:1560 (+) comp14378_c1_seq1:183-4862(+)